MAGTSRRLLLISGLSLGSACVPRATPPDPDLAVEQPTRNPPAPRWQTRPAAEPLAPDLPVGGLDRLLNETLPSGERVYASSSGGCHYYAKTDQPRPPGQMGPIRDLRCPDAMLDPAWGHCTGGSSLFVDSAGEICTCAPTGNPPPPAYGIPCPKM